MAGFPADRRATGQGTARSMFVGESHEAPPSVSTQRELDEMRYRWESGQQSMFVTPAGHDPEESVRKSRAKAHPWEELVEEAKERQDDLSTRRVLFFVVAVGYLCVALLPPLLRWWSPPALAGGDAESSCLGGSFSTFSVQNLAITALLLVATQVLFVWDWTPPEYPLYLDRRESAFTLQDHRRGDEVLAIDTMDLGPAQEAWHDSFPDTPIDSDDHILEVNGLRGCAFDMIQEIRRTNDLALKIGCRGPFSTFATVLYAIVAGVLGGVTAISVGFGLLGAWSIVALCALSGFLASHHQSPACMSGHNDLAFRPGAAGSICEPLIAILGTWLFLTAVMMTIMRQLWPLFSAVLSAEPDAAGGFTLVPYVNVSNATAAAPAYLAVASEWQCVLFNSSLSCPAVESAAGDFFGWTGLSLFCVGGLFMALGQVMKKKHCESFMLEDSVDLDPLTYQTSAAHATPLVSKLRSSVRSARRSGRGPEGARLLWESGADPRESELVMWSIDKSRSAQLIHKAELQRSLWPFALQAFGFALWNLLSFVRLDGCLRVSSGVQRTLLAVLLSMMDDEDTQVQDPGGLLRTFQTAGLAVAALIVVTAGVLVPLLWRTSPDCADRAPAALLPVLFVFSFSVISSPIWPFGPDGTNWGISPDWKPHHEPECAGLLSSALPWEFWAPQWLACVDWVWFAMMSRAALFAFYLMEVMHRSLSLGTNAEVSPQEEDRALKQLQAVADSILDPVVVRNGQEAPARFALEVERRIGSFVRPSYRFGES